MELVADDRVARTLENSRRLSTASLSTGKLVWWQRRDVLARISENDAMHDCHTQQTFMEVHFLGPAKRPPLSLARGDVIGNSGRPCRAAFKAPRLWLQPQNAAAREAKHTALGHVGSCRPLVTRGRPKLWSKGTALVLSSTGGGQRWKGFFFSICRGLCSELGKRSGARASCSIVLPS